jgi:hypothetical protein
LELITPLEVRLKDKAIPLHALAGPEGSRRLRLPTLKKSESKYRL